MASSIAIARVAAIAVLLITAGSDGARLARAETRRPFLGACYCRVGQTLHCTSDLSEPDCRRRCDEALCDDWFWKERLPCWNWGYGG
jgi:hypothetical protein